MKKFIIPLVLAVALAVLLPLNYLQSQAEGETKSEAINDDALITYGYLQQFKEELRAEIIAELTSQGVNVASAYTDISFKEGQIIILDAETEVIYRGGGAVAITSSNQKGEGVSDMSAGTELFSGESLEYGHIYYASESESKKAILITGAAAYFTIRGDYELG